MYVYVGWLNVPDTGIFADLVQLENLNDSGAICASSLKSVTLFLRLGYMLSF